MSAFLVARTIPGLDAEQMRAMQRALLVASRGSGVRYTGSAWLPAEQRCLCLYDAAGRDDVRRVNDMAQVPFAWMAEAIEMPA